MADIQVFETREDMLVAFGVLTVEGMAPSAVVRGGITVKPHVQAFFDALEVEIGAPLSIGTYPGHSPPEGPTQAGDVFNADSPAGYAVQDRMCAFARKHAKRYGVRYCIRRAQIWNIERDGEDWRNQSRTGNRTTDHFDHVHFTFYAVAEPSPSPAPAPPAPTPTPTPEDDMASPYTLFNWGGAVWAWSGGDPLPLDDWGQVEPYLRQGAVTIGDLTDEQFRSIAPTWTGRHPAADKDQAQALAAVRG